MTRQKKCAENGAQLYGPRVSNFLSHRIVKSLTFRIYGKLKFQCTRNGPRNPPFLSMVSPGHLYYFVLDLSPPDVSKTCCTKQKYRRLKIWKSKNPGSLLVHLWEKTNQLTFQDRLLRFSDFQFSIMFSFAKYFRKICW